MANPSAAAVDIALSATVGGTGTGTAGGASGGTNTAAVSFAATPTETQLAPPPQVKDQVPLPPPSHFDILPPLYTLLARLEPGIEAAIESGRTGASLADETGTVSLSGQTETAGGDEKKPQQLNYKDAPVAASFLKTRIRKTLAELRGLDDMDRTVQEQTSEIQMLQRRIQAQRGMLGKLGREAGEALALLA